MNPNIARLGLGTVQFGGKYGITNKTGQPTTKECHKIIDAAYDAGIRYYDTAAYYGHADLVLENGLLDRTKARIVSKVKSDKDIARAKMMHGDKLYALLGDVTRNQFPRVGKSIYWAGVDPHTVDIVQLPLHIADRRNLPLVKFYKDHGVEVHVRSVFLQGLLLERGATIRQCLKFVLDQPVDVALVGVNSLDELKQILEAVETLDQETSTVVPFIESDRLDPRTWR